MEKYCYSKYVELCLYIHVYFVECRLSRLPEGELEKNFLVMAPLWDTLTNGKDGTRHSERK